MNVLHYIFLVMFLQAHIKLFVFLSFVFLFIYSVGRVLLTGKLKREFLVFAFPLLYWLFNLIYISEPAQLIYESFYRYDGKFITIYTVFLMLLISIDYQTERQFIIRIKYLLIILWIVSLCEFNPVLGISLFDSHNANAGFLGSVIIISIIILWKFNTIFGFNKFLLVLIIAYLLFLFISFFSRAFSFALIITLIFFFLLDKENRSLKYIIHLILFIGVFLVFSYFFSDLLQRILIMVSNPDKDYNIFTRLMLWKLAASLWLENIKNVFLGIGIGRFNDISSRYIYNCSYSGTFFFGEYHAHNIVLQILVEQGIIGLVIFFLPGIYIYKKLKQILKSRKNDIPKFIYQVFVCLFVYLFVASQFGLNFFTPSTSVVFYVILANAIAYLKILKREWKHGK